MSACELDDGMPSQGQQIPADRAHQCAEDDVIIDDIGRDYTGPDGLSDI